MCTKIDFQDSSNSKQYYYSTYYVLNSRKLPRYLVNGISTSYRMKLSLFRYKLNKGFQIP